MIVKFINSNERIPGNFDEDSHDSLKIPDQNLTITFLIKLNIILNRIIYEIVQAPSCRDGQLILHDPFLHFC